MRFCSSLKPEAVDREIERDMSRVLEDAPLAPQILVLISDDEDFAYAVERAEASRN